MNALENHLFERISAAITAIDPPTAREVYAFYLVFSLDEHGDFWPEIMSLTWLAKSGVTPEKARSYGSKWSGWAASGEAVLSLCNEKSDAAGFALQTTFYESLLVDEPARKNWKTLLQLWPFRWQDEEELPPEVRAQVEARLDALEIAPADRRWVFQMTAALSPLDLCGAFFPVVETVIRQLHTRGIVRQTCGRDVPIGFMATNDVGYAWGLEATRRANLPGLASEMEEWMMGESYAVVEARQKLESEIALLPRAEQAAFWVACDLETQLFFRSDKRSDLIDDLEERGLVSKTADSGFTELQIFSRLSEVFSATAPLLIEEIARLANNEPNVYSADQHQNQDLASHLLGMLENMATQANRDAVPESAIALLQETQRKLWREAQSRDKIGACLQYTFRVLHRLRPDRFPLPQHDRRDHNRVLNAADYGLQ